MGREKYPSATLDQYMVRFPEGMRDHLKEMAAHNKRSLNAEIIARLTEYLSLKHAQPHYALAVAERDSLAKELAETQERVNTLQAELTSERQKIDMLHVRHEEYRSTMESELANAKSASLPESLIKRIERRASETGRQVHEEIVQALEKAFPPASETEELIKILEALLDGERYGSIKEKFESDPATKRLREYLKYLKAEQAEGRGEGARARLKDVFPDDPVTPNDRDR